MKNTIILLAFCIFSTSVWGQETKTLEIDLVELDTINRRDKPENPVDVDYSAAFGVMIGTDIGGAVPFPFSNIPSPFNAYPQINGSIGAKISFTLIKNWGLGAEFSYKTIGMKADARVRNQKFNDKGNITYFTGSAKMNMEFSMLEVPLYVTYNFKRYGKVLAGGYFSHLLSGTFETDPKMGYMGDKPNTHILSIGAPVIPGDSVATINMSFSDYLDNWDAGVLIGYERKVHNRFFITLKMSMGFKDIFKSSSDYFDYSMLHLRGSVAVSYALFATKPFIKIKKRD